MNKKLKALLEKRKEIEGRIDTAKNDEELNEIETELRKNEMKIKIESRNLGAEEDQETEEEDEDNYLDENGQAKRTHSAKHFMKKQEEKEKRSAEYTPGIGFRKVDGVEQNNEKEFRNVGNEKVELKELDKRGEIWKGNNREERSVVLDDTILIPKHQSNVVKGIPFNEVSSILDLVTVTPFQNGDTYDVPFEYETGEAGYSSEPNADGSGGEYNEVGIKFGSSKIRKATLTTYTEISKQFLKTPSANYAERVQLNVVKSVYKKIAKEIVIGAGGDNAIQGILTQPKKVQDKDGKSIDNLVIDEDMEFKAITADTLTDIIYQYGGDNDVEEGLVLLMNKMTLKEFKKLKDANGNNVHEIKTFGATFTIDGVKGVFTAHIKSFEQAGVGEYFIAYGNIKAYELALFGALEVEESIHYKFRQGLISYRADESIGGNLTAFKSWIRVKKGAVTKGRKPGANNEDN